METLIMRSPCSILSIGLSRVSGGGSRLFRLRMWSLDTVKDATRTLPVSIACAGRWEALYTTQLGVCKV